MYVIQAEDNETGEIFQVEMDGLGGAYKAACELAVMVGIEIDDG